MSHALRVAIADQIAFFRAYNTDGSAKTDLTSATAGLSLSVFRVGAAAVSVGTLSAKAADNTAHADGAIRAVSGNLYTVDLPDAACADQVPSISVKGSYTGGVIEGPEHPVVGYNPTAVAVGANTTAPDNASAVAAAASAATAATQATAGAASAASADGKLTSGRLSRIDRLPDINPGAGGGLALVGSLMGLDSVTAAALFQDIDVAALLASIVAQFDQAGDLPVQTIAALSASATVAALVANGQIITLLSDAAAANVAATAAASSSATAATQSTAAAVSSAAAKVVTDKLNTGLVFDGVVYQWTANALELAPAGGGGGGSGDADQATLLEVQATAVAIAASLAGGPVRVVGRVNGGRLTVYVGDDWRVRSGTAQAIPVSDPAGGLYTKLAAIGAANLQFGASRLNAAAGLITGTVVSVTQTTIDTVLHCLISVEMTSAGVGLQLSDDYEYQISQRQTHGDEGDDFIEVSGQLSLRARRVGIPA